MPLLTDEIVDVPSGFKFGATSIDELGASEYTLVVIVQDVSSSVSSFKSDMEACLKQILDACQKSPRSENLLLRLVQFNSGLVETHGFKLLSTIDADEYDNILKVGGATALYDATYTGMESVGEYGKILTGQDFTVNGIVFVITDGEDNSSRYTPAKLKGLRDSIMKEESLESLRTVLVGVDHGYDSYLDGFKNEAEIDQYVGIGDANPKSLAKLAEFVSQSISSQSQALGTGGASKSLSF